ncbi:Uncharacterized protein SVXHr_0013 [Halorhabdus sp. SVX81]|uniref:DUF7260 family protein n=1 Tax=Halorhabdus sp. SVX81 TaxID=2978283 RepID=UPI0023DC4597|nr:hypothetical protein [Halorhabdus sp. SVX81]WEL16198.1 Uncharacterized protein SVXHr_0013 [Halorhabdus sp. SVX81]
MPEIVQPKIDRAYDCIDEERALLEAERDAFQTLRRRVSTIQVDQSGPTAVETGNTVAVTTPSFRPQSGGLRKIRDAYRETVMAVPHYDSEYGESLRENLEVECGASLARHLLDGDVLTPAMYNAFVDACTQAQDTRERTLTRIEHEQQSLERFETALTDIESTVIDVSEQLESASRSRARIDETLETAQTRCMDHASERQEQLHERAEKDIPGVERLSLVEYLYADLETTTPVLSDIAACLETIRHQRRRCLR